MLDKTPKETKTLFIEFEVLKNYYGYEFSSLLEREWV